MEKFKHSLKPVSPFNKNAGFSAKGCFDRKTGRSVEISWLKSNIEVVAQYHLRPELKFLNGNYLDCGITKRRHINVNLIRHIGKEADHWEEQFYLGVDEATEIIYGLSPNEMIAVRKKLNFLVRKFGERQVSKSAGISRAKLKSMLRDSQIQELHRISLAVEKLELANSIRQKEIEKNLICAAKEIAKIGISEFAKRLNADPSNLSKILNKKRTMSRSALRRLQAYFVSV